MSEASDRVRGPVHVDGEVVATKRIGGYRHVTLTAPGVPERFRAGNFVAVTIEGHVARRALWVHRVRASSAFGPTLDVVVEPRGSGTTWLAAQPVGARVAITGPLGRPFALPKEAVSCLLVGEGYAAAPLFPLAERLRERGCAVSLVVSAPDESHLLSALEARQHPWRNVVTRALSGGEDPEVDLTEVEPQPGDRYLICSDGLFSVVGDPEITEILGDTKRSLQEICTALIGAANAGGGPDNITALVLELDVS